jgi:predicted NBD/HSP70 family sugar kinase
MLSAARSLLKAHLNRDTLAVGISTPGFVDLAERTILVHPGFETRSPLSLAPLFKLAGKRPVILENDMHALTARWLLTQKTGQQDDILLVHFDDGEMGAALLVGGRPNRGCATGANELGHTRLPVQTERCFCGHTGCLERICSTAFLRRRPADTGTLHQRAAAYQGLNDPALDEVVRYLSLGFANAVNFSRVQRLVLVSSLLRYPAFLEALLKGVRSRLMGILAPRVEIEIWDQPVLRLAETSGWLALAGLLLPGWGPE